MRCGRAGLFCVSVLLVWSLPAKAQELDVTGPLASPSDPREMATDVSIRSKPPARSAADWEVDAAALGATPKRDGADALAVVPGVFVGERSALGRAPRLSLRGFEGTSGQDVAIFLGNIPLNQVSNVRGPGYADMRLVMPEVIDEIGASSGPYDPRQGDFALAGSMKMSLRTDRPGFRVKGTYGSFDTRRALVTFTPSAHGWRNSFAAFETYGTDGAGTGRGGDRSSFVGQLAHVDGTAEFRLIAALGTARFDFPGYLDQRDVERGLYPYSSRSPLGRDQNNQAHLGAEITWNVDDGTITLGAFGSKTSMAVRQDLTGYVLDLKSGLPPHHRDDSEQRNDAFTVGGNVAYQRSIKLVSKADTIAAGAYMRLDSIDQKDTRLAGDGVASLAPIDANIQAMNLASWLDLSLRPVRRLVLRGGPRLDSLSYSVDDHAAGDGLQRTAQGLHLGTKVVADYALGSGIHAIASYGEGFRSPDARTLREGERVPFASVRSVEAGLRQKQPHYRASLVGFRSWLSQDRVFDPLERRNAPGPSSARVGIAAAFAAQSGPFQASTSATYTHAVFTGSDVRFHDGDSVPYAPRLVVRSDASFTKEVGTLDEEPVTLKIGTGIEGAAVRFLPDGTAAKNAFFVDALSSVAWREFELGVTGTNLLGLQYYDAQYQYVSNFERSPSLAAARSNVLVASPTTVLATLQIRIGGKEPRPYDPGEHAE